MARGTRDNTVYDERLALLSEVDIFVDLPRADMRAIADAAPLRTWPAGARVYAADQPVEMLYILKRGRVRIFRTGPDGRALTTAVIQPGTIFGEMVLLGQQMYDNHAEALDEALICYMNRADVYRFLMSDARIATRIAEILGRRLATMEQRLSDSHFKTVPQRVAATLCALADREHGAVGPPTPRGNASGRAAARPTRLRLTHDQLAMLVGTTRETTSKALGEFAERGLVKLRRGAILVLDRARLARAGEEQA